MMTMDLPASAPWNMAVVVAARVLNCQRPIPAALLVTVIGPVKEGPLTPLEVERALRRSNVAGCFASLFGVCVAGQFLNGYVLQIVGDNKRAAAFAAAMLAAIPLIGYAFQIWTAVATERQRARRPLWFRLAFTGRLMWVGIAAAALGMTEVWPRMELLVFLGLFFIASAASSASSPVWFSWMADLVPKDQVGRFWGTRRALLNAVGLSIFGAGLFVDWGRTTFGEDSSLPYVLLFALGAVVGITDLLIHNSVPEPPMQGEPKTLNWRALLAQPLRDEQFRRYMLYMCAWSSVINFGNAFLNLLFLQELNLSQAWIAWFTCAMVLTRVFMARFWGYLVDRFGAAPINAICTFGLIFVPLGYVFVTPQNAIPLITLTFVYAGFFNIGIETTHTALMLGISPASNKAMFVAVTQSLVGLCAAVSPLLGAVFLNFAMDHPLNFGQWFHLGEWCVAGFQELFLAAFLLRICVAPLSLRLGQIQPGAVSLVVRRLFDANPFTVIHHTYVLGGSSVEAERLAAVRKLAEARSPIATAELARSLQDPSLEVRVEAARALGRIGDVAAVDSLIESLNSPESGIQQEATAALGKIGHRRGVRALIEALGNPAVQRSAIIALGEIRDSLAVHPLLDLLQNEKADVALRALAAEALSRIVEHSPAAYDVLPRVFAVFRAAQSDLLRQQLALAIGNLVGEPGEFYDLLARERRLAGQGIARALAQMTAALRAGRASSGEEGRWLGLLESGRQHYAAERWPEAAHDFALVGLGREGLLNVGEPPPLPAQRKEMVAAMEEAISALKAPVKRKAKLWLLVRAGVDECGAEGTPREEALLALYCLSGLLSQPN